MGLKSGALLQKLLEWRAGVATELCDGKARVVTNPLNLQQLSNARLVRVFTLLTRPHLNAIKTKEIQPEVFVNRKAQEQNDKIVEEYIRGDRMTRQVIEDTLEPVPVPRSKRPILVFAALAVSPYVALNIMGYWLVQDGTIRMDPTLWILDGITGLGVVIGTIGLWFTYRSHKPSIHNLIADYAMRHKGSPLIKQYYGF